MSAMGDLIDWSFLASAAGVDDSSERKKGDTKEHPLGQWFLKHSETEELSILTAARQQVYIVRSLGLMMRTCNGNLSGNWSILRYIELEVAYSRISGPLWLSSCPRWQLPLNIESCGAGFLVWHFYQSEYWLSWPSYSDAADRAFPLFGSGVQMLTLVDLVLLNVKWCYWFQVHAQIAKLKRELSAHESEALRLKSSTSHWYSHDPMFFWHATEVSFDCCSHDFQVDRVSKPIFLVSPFQYHSFLTGENLPNPNQSQSQFSCNASFILLTTKMIRGFMMSVKNLWLGQIQKRTLLRGTSCPNITLSGMAHGQ